MKMMFWILLLRMLVVASASSERETDMAVIVSFADICESSMDLLSPSALRSHYFEDRTVVFVAAVWLAGISSKRLGMPSLVGEIACGFLLGPPLADFVPYPHAMTVIGSLGLIGLILESGISLDVAQLKEVGMRAIVMGFVGSALPLACGYGLGLWQGLDTESAIALGAAFAPSSLGIAASALSTGDVLNTPVGQTILATSVVDDVLGLILLSVLDVFVQTDASALDYVIPFVSSFGFLFFLGYLGIAWFPHVVEEDFLHMFSEEHRPVAAFALMFALLTAYMPLLNYSKASYLTGVFLAGMSFSKIHSVRVVFQEYARPILRWLLRIFFAATIGFQVPITEFTDPYVLKWGAILLIPVVAKVPLGLFVPKFQRKVADDFPYNPYRRDVATTSLAMVCRGEFNFIIAAFALGEGLFDPRVYSACIFAILFASVAVPLLLVCLIRYYSQLADEYYDGDHPIERIGNTCDGYRPLFVAIQARTPVRWGLQEKIQRALEEEGLILIDHRSWRTLENDDEVDVTEVFAQDSLVKIRVSQCFTSSRRDGLIDKVSSETELSSLDSSSVDVEANESEEAQVKERCDKIQSILSSVLDDAGDFVIQVSQWEAFTFEGNTMRNKAGYYTLHTNAQFSPRHRRTVSLGSRRPRLDSMEDPMTWVAASDEEKEAFEQQIPVRP